jgi:hypothetical protein
VNHLFNHLIITVGDKGYEGKMQGKVKTVLRNEPAALWIKYHWGCLLVVWIVTPFTLGTEAPLFPGTELFEVSQLLHHFLKVIRSSEILADCHLNMPSFLHTEIWQTIRSYSWKQNSWWEQPASLWPPSLTGNSRSRQVWGRDSK